MLTFKAPSKAFKGAELRPATTLGPLGIYKGSVRF